MSKSPEKLTPVSKAHPCRVCGGDHKCSTGDGGLLICGRRSGDVVGFTHLGESKDPQFHLYRPEGEDRPAPRKRKATDWEERAAGFAAEFDAKARQKLAAALGVPEGVLALLPGLGANRRDAEGPCWTFPERDGAGRAIGLNRRFLKDGKKKFVAGGNRGLTLVEGWRDRPGAVYLVEGASDVLALTAAGLAAVGRPNNTAGALHLATALNDWPADRPVVVVGENDRKADGRWPGKEGAEQLAAALAAKLNRAVAVAFPPDGAKDARAWLVARAKAADWPAAGREFAAALTATPVAPPPPPKFPLTDYGNAQRLAARHGRDLRYAPQLGGWYVWDGARWEADRTGEIVRRAKDTVRAIYAEAAEERSADRRELVARHAFNSEGIRRIYGMVDLTQSEPGVAVSTDQMDHDPWLLNCPNGTVDLRTGEIRQHRREDLLTKLCPIAYDAAAECPLWLRTLALIFPVDPADPAAGGNEHLIGYVRRLLGLCLTGRVESILPIFWGGGANGKSTILNTVRAVLGGGYAMQAPPNFLMAKNNDNHPTELADLYGQRLVIATETRQNRRIDEALIKQLTGGERVRARRMRQDFFEFDPTHKLILCTNHRPRVSESDEGIWRRLALIPFAVRFWNPDRKGEFGLDHLRQDKQLPDRLAAEHPGILRWMVAGCLEWQANGLGTPPEVEQQTAEYRADEDVIGQFLAERVEVGNAGYAEFKDVYAAYRAWSEQADERSLSSRQFAADLRRRGHRVERGSGNKMVCHGFRLGATAEEAADLSRWDQ